jgi:hypothetical protein
VTQGSETGDAGEADEEAFNAEAGDGEVCADSAT